MNKHSLTDLAEVITVNTATFVATTFTNIESVLKIILLLVSIGYTCYKWFKDHKEKK